jgi:hypothetical protein
MVRLYRLIESAAVYLIVLAIFAALAFGLAVALVRALP